MSKLEIIGLTTSLIIGVICCILHKKKGYNPIAGFLWGFLFSIFGLLIVIFEKTKEQHGDEMNNGSKSIGFYLALFVGIGTVIIAITLFAFARMQTRNNNNNLINNTTNDTNNNLISDTTNDANDDLISDTTNDANNNLISDTTNDANEDLTDNTTNDANDNEIDNPEDIRNNEYVSVLLNDSGEKGTYKIPYINLKSSDARRFNDLFSIYAKNIKEKKYIDSTSFSSPWEYSTDIEDNIKDLYDTAINLSSEVNYDFYQNGKILSLVLKGKGDLETIKVVAINFDINTGELLANDDLMEYNSVTFLDIFKKYPQILFDNIDYREELMKETNTSSFDEVMNYSGDKKLLISTFIKDSESFDCARVPMFLDSDGTINVFAPVHWFNAGTTNRIIDMNI